MSQQTVTPANRIHYLDQLRAVLMLGGIIVHCLRIYTVDATWKISDPVSHSIVFDWVNTFLHLFRLQSFFILSGILFMRSAVRHGADTTWHRRLTRIGIPTVTVLLLVNTLEALICNHFYRIPFGKPVLDFSSVLQTGWISHLWFLFYLIGYHAIAWGVLKVWDRVTGKALKLSDKWMPYVALLPFVYAFCDVCIRCLMKVVPLQQVQILGLNLFDWALWLPLYLVGVLLGTNTKLIDELSRVRPVHLAGLVVSTLLLWNNPLSGVAALALDRFSGAVVVWILCVLCFSVFRQFLNSERPVFRRVANASFTMYLFSHIIVISVGITLMYLDCSVWLKFAFVLIASTFASYALHEFFIEKFPMAALLFNGVTGGERRPSPAPPSGSSEAGKATAARSTVPINAATVGANSPALN